MCRLVLLRMGFLVWGYLYIYLKLIIKQNYLEKIATLNRKKSAELVAMLVRINYDTIVYLQFHHWTCCGILFAM